MAYDVPLPSELKIRFPIFASVSNVIVDAAIVEANRQVDDSWTEPDFAPAIMYLAAHNMVMEGVVSITGAPSPVTTGPLTGMSTGDASESYAQSRTGGIDMGQYGATEYGQRFAALRKRNVGGPVII